MAKTKELIILITILILLIIFIWGFIGGQEAQKVGVTCDMGIGEDDTLCWQWHKNIIGEIQEGFQDTGNVIDDYLNN